MSLYGYQRETTPNEVAERNNMLLYQNAYSPAAITNMSVPIVLSNIDIDNYQKELKKLSDNIVNAANHVGYNTYWYSTQGGALGITAIATFSKNKKFLNGYDEILVKRLLERGKTSGRSDDADENIIRNRIKEYYTKTAEVAELYKKQGKYVEVNGVGEIAEIAEKLYTEVEKIK